MRWFWVQTKALLIFSLMLVISLIVFGCVWTVLGLALSHTPGFIIVFTLPIWLVGFFLFPFQILNPIWEEFQQITGSK